MSKELLLDILNNRFTHRIVVYVVCGMTLLVCFVTICSIFKTRRDILDRIDQAVAGSGQGAIRLAEREPFVPNLSSARAGIKPSDRLRALQEQD